MSEHRIHRKADNSNIKQNTMGMQSTSQMKVLTKQRSHDSECTLELHLQFNVNALLMCHANTTRNILLYSNFLHNYHNHTNALRQPKYSTDKHIVNFVVKSHWLVSSGVWKIQQNTIHVYNIWKYYNLSSGILLYLPCKQMLTEKAINSK
jgi:hypothetical protein